MDLTAGVKFVKKANQSPLTSDWVPGGDADQEKTQEIVRDMLKKIETGREEACMEYARKHERRYCDSFAADFSANRHRA